MTNFPSKWFDFTNSKEIKRIRKDLKETLSLKIEISASLVLTIVAFYFGEYVKDFTIFWQIVFCIGLCALVVLIFSFSAIIHCISVKRHGNVIIKGKDAVSIFDDEIVYNVLVAVEYSNSINSIPDNPIKDEMEKLYIIEIEYYITKAIDELLEFNTNYQKIFGNGKMQIPKNRIFNIIRMIELIIDSNILHIDEDKISMFEEYKKMISAVFEASTDII